jgi:hypothetical protein
MTEYHVPDDPSTLFGEAVTSPAHTGLGLILLVLGVDLIAVSPALVVAVWKVLI